MELTVAIRCGDDERVLRCIKSVDEDVEIVVALSPNPSIEEKIDQLGVRKCLTPRGNLSVVSNIGLNAASHDRVVFTDSDTVFEPNCIKQLNDALDTHKAARAGIIFDADPSRPGSRLVAGARDYVNSLPLFFTPGVAIRRDLLVDIGGYLFDDTVPYAVDANLNYRMEKAEIDVAWLMDRAFIRHDAEGCGHDLKAAFRIGAGCRRSVHNFSTNPSYNDIGRNSLKATKLSHYPGIVKKKGLATAGYQAIWDMAFYLGYCRQWAGEQRR